MGYFYRLPVMMPRRRTHWYLGLVSISDMMLYRKISWKSFRSREIGSLNYRIALKFWQALRQHCCWGACQFSGRSKNSKYKSLIFETLRDFTIKRLIEYWNRAQGGVTSSFLFIPSFSKLSKHWLVIYWVSCKLSSGFILQIENFHFGDIKVRSFNNDIIWCNDKVIPFLTGEVYYAHQ